MSPSDVQFCTAMADFSNGIGRRINASPALGKALKVAELLYRRMVNSCNSIMILARDAPHDCRVDIGMLLRGIYDAMLQCMFILCDGAKQEGRASLYLDFQTVEQVKLMEIVDRNESDLAHRVPNSPLRAEAEPAIRQEYERVKGRFLNKKGEPHQTWYEGSLRDLARHAGYEQEYEMFQNELSTLTHSSPFAMDHPQPGPGVSRVIAQAWFLSLRPLRAIAALAGVTLTQDEVEALAEAGKTLVDFDSGPRSPLRPSGA
jgi:hypothetical protein